MLILYEIYHRTVETEVIHLCVFGVLFLFFIYVFLEFCSCFSFMCVWSFVLVFHLCVFGVLFLFFIYVCLEFCSCLITN